jgi:DNA-binding NarL/FixJ family response regulator
MVSEQDKPHPGQEDPRHRCTTYKIVVADDHPLFRSALKEFFDAQDGLEVVAEAADGQEAVQLCRRLQPELVVMDVSMPKLDGLEATIHIKEELPRTIVLMLTASEEPNHLSRALEVGAAGYVLKTLPPKQIVEAVRNTLAGESPLNPELASRLLLRLMEKAPKKAENEEESLRLRSLSPREEEVLRLMARGHANQQIARELHLSVSTVKKHARNIILKLEVSDRTQAAVKAIELGVI